MLQAIVRWSLNNRIAVGLVAALLLLTGLFAAQNSRLDVFPEFAPPQVIIQIEAPGLPRLDVLRSQSIQGLSVVTLVFQNRTDIYRARQQAAERLAELAGQFPAGVKPPRMTPLTSTTGRLLTAGYTSRTLTPMELRD